MLYMEVSDVVESDVVDVEAKLTPELVSPVVVDCDGDVV